MSNVYDVPVTPQTPQTFTISLAGVFYNLTVRWCSQMASWFANIADANNNPMINGIPLITGIDLLGQYAYLGIGGQLVVQTDSNPNEVPTFESLGDTGHLYFVVPEAATVIAAVPGATPGPPLPTAPTYRLVNTLTEVTVLASDQIIGVDTNALGSATSFTLPMSASRLGVPLVIKDVGLKAATFNITLTCAGGEEIEPQGVSPPGQAASLVIRNNGQAVELLPLATGGWQRLG